MSDSRRADMASVEDMSCDYTVPMSTCAQVVPMLIRGTAPEAIPVMGRKQSRIMCSGLHRT
ncbi:hypothetical protein [Antrihabitans stalactiti]|uniref:hypothetical protein n=1 Tax=Antrihabitans stalactiti TaxID=2584121 RepID=UPI003B84A300